MLFESANGRSRPHLFHQPIDDLDAGEVAFVYCAVEGLTGECLAVQSAVRIAIEETADLVFKFGDPFNGLGHQRPGEILIAKPFAALDRVHEMTLDRIAGLERDVVAALDHPGATAFP